MRLRLRRATEHAIAEFHGGVPRPGTLVPYQAEAATLVDLTTRVDPAGAAALDCDWKKLALIEGEGPASWTLAQALSASGADGALVSDAEMLRVPGRKRFCVARGRTGRRCREWAWALRG